MRKRMGRIAEWRASRRSLLTSTAWRSLHCTNRGTTPVAREFARLDCQVDGCDLALIRGNADAPAEALLVAVSDSTIREVVGRELQRNLISVHDLDAIAPESSGHRRQHRSAGVEFDRKHSSFELFYNFTEYFDCVFFWQIVSTFPMRFEPLKSVSSDCCGGFRRSRRFHGQLSDGLRLR